MPRPLPPASRAGFIVAAAGDPVAAALCIHGYTGSPYEVRPIADALAGAGVSSVGVLLPGHGTTPEDLHATTAGDWFRAARAAFDALPKRLPRVLVGSSMGGLLALRIAAARPDDVAAVVVLAPALRFHIDGFVASRAARRGAWRLKRFLPKSIDGGDIAAEDARRAMQSYPVLPLRGVGEVGALQRVVERELSKVRAPLCIFHGRQDHTIPPLASELVMAGVSSSLVERHLLRDTFHVVGIDVDRDLVCDLSVRFVQRALA